MRREYLAEPDISPVEKRRRTLAAQAKKKIVPRKNKYDRDDLPVEIIRSDYEHDLVRVMVNEIPFSSLEDKYNMPALQLMRSSVRMRKRFGCNTTLAFVVKLFRLGLIE